MLTPVGTWNSKQGRLVGYLDPNAICVTYILSCGGNNYYIGHTNNFYRRLAQHYTGRGSNITRIFKVKEVIWVSTPLIRIEAAELETWLQKQPRIIPYNYKVLPYMSVIRKYSVIILQWVRAGSR